MGGQILGDGFDIIGLVLDHPSAVKDPDLNIVGYAVHGFFKTTKDMRKNKNKICDNRGVHFKRVFNPIFLFCFCLKVDVLFPVLMMERKDT